MHWTCDSPFADCVPPTTGTTRFVSRPDSMPSLKRELTGSHPDMLAPTAIQFPDGFPVNTIHIVRLLRVIEDKMPERLLPVTELFYVSRQRLCHARSRSHQAELCTSTCDSTGTNVDAQITRSRRGRAAQKLSLVDSRELVEQRRAQDVAGAESGGRQQRPYQEREQGFG